MNIELTKQEADALVALLDIAARARGLEVAKACVLLAEKVNSARNTESKANANVVTLNIPQDGTTGSGGGGSG